MTDEARLLRPELPLDPEGRRARAALLVRMGDACRRTGDAQAARAAYEAALESHPVGAAAAGLGYLFAASGELERALDWFSQAAERLRQEGERARAAEAESNGACMLYTQGSWARAAALFERTLAERRAEGDLRGEALDLLNLAGCRLALGEPEGAVATYEASAELARAQGDAVAQANARSGAGQACLQLGRSAEAQAAFEEASALFLAAGEDLAAKRARLGAGDAAHRAGDVRGAIACYQGTLDALTQHLPTVEAARLRCNLGSMLYESGDAEKALEAFDCAQSTLQDADRAGAVATQLLANRGLALIALGRFDEARADLDRARVGHRALGEHRELAQTTASLSDLCRYRGDLAGAIASHRAVLELEAEHGFLLGEGSGLLFARIADPGLAIEEVTGQGSTRPEPAALSLPPRGQRPVVLFAPPVLGTHGPIFPRGATAVASALNHHGVPALVVPLSHYVDVYAGAEQSEERIQAVIREVLDAYRPRAVGVSVTFSYVYPQGLEIVRTVREAAPEVPIVIGGPHVTYWDEQCLLEAPGVDVVVRGEGEWTALETFRVLEAKGDLGSVAGITWRDGDVIRKNPRRPLGDLLELPPIDFTLLPRSFCERMEISGLTSRGCSFRCAFCHEFRYWGAKVRQYPAQRVVDELELMAVEYGNTMRGIDDSMLSMLEPNHFELCELLGRSPHRPERFNFLTRIDTVSDEGLAAMKRAGISSLSIGIESGSQKVLEAMNKGFGLETVLQSVTRVRAAGVGLAAFFIVGHPGEDLAEAERTRAFVDRLFREELVGWIDMSIFTPYPGTPFFTNPKAYGVEILSLDWSKWRRSNRPIAQLTEFSAGEIYLSYLRLLEAQANHHARRPARRHVGLRE